MCALGTTLLPTGVATGGTNSTATAIVGRLVKLHSISLVIEDGRRQVWVPREAILLVELQPEPNALPDSAPASR